VRAACRRLTAIVGPQDGAVTLEDLPENIDLGGNIAALNYLDAALSGFAEME